MKQYFEERCEIHGVVIITYESEHERLRIHLLQLQHVTTDMYMCTCDMCGTCTCPCKNLCMLAQRATAPKPATTNPARVAACGITFIQQGAN